MTSSRSLFLLAATALSVTAYSPNQNSRWYENQPPSEQRSYERSGPYSQSYQDQLRTFERSGRNSGPVSQSYQDQLRTFERSGQNPGPAFRERGGDMVRNDEASFGDNYYPSPPQGYGEGSLVQGESRQSYSSNGRRSHVTLSSDGRPLESNVELWDGPDNVATRARVWSEDGRMRPFEMSVERNGVGYGPRGEYYGRGTVDVRNTGPVEFPLRADINTDINNGRGYRNGGGYRTGGGPGTEILSMDSAYQGALGGPGIGEKIQGETVRHFAIPPDVSSARITIASSPDGGPGMPVSALVELLQGPNRVAQLAEVYNQHGKPYSVVVQTPGAGSTIGIKNEGPVEYPFYAKVEALTFDRSGGYGGGGGYSYY